MNYGTAAVMGGFRKWAAGFVALAGLAISPAWSAPVQTEHTVSQLVAEGPAVPGQPLWVALDQKLQDGWHTYWINPGDSGLPTEVNWTLPAGWKAGPLNFPAPHRFTTGPLVNYGYEKATRVLARLDVPADAKPGGTVTLTAAANWLICADVCVPEDATLTLDVPVAAPGTASGAPDPAVAPLFAEARAALPVPSPYAASVSATKTAATVRLAAPGLTADQVKDAYFFAENPDLVEAGAPQQLAVTTDGLTLTLKPTGRATPGPVNGILEVTELVNGQPTTQALAIAIPADAVGAAPAGGGVAADTGSAPVLPLWQAVLFACLGGMVLNLMPCVFPVLSMKAMALVRHQGAHARLHGLVYTAGVLACFAAIAIVLMALRAGGQEIGWGFQLQSPLVVAVLAYVMLLLGLSMSGVFTVGDQFMGVGQGLTQGDGYAGSFFTGVLASVVATPCTAPFMGAAVGYALVQPWYVALAVFLALGFGMALPFLALACSPWLLRHLPKPGAWMERLKQVLAFPLYGSAAWLVWVFAVQVGAPGMTGILVGLVLVGFAAWLYGVTHYAEGWGRRGGALAALVALVLAVAAVLPQAGGNAASAGGPVAGGKAVAMTDGFEAFSPATLDKLRADGRPVLVDFTAAWCITCLVNERVALSSDTVHQALKGHNVALLKGDWTNRDAEITRVLQAHGRSGVPLYLFYRPGQAEPDVWPQILTEAQVLEAVGSLPKQSASAQ
ncbi:protein-disulfide reductase DsbD family protein [Nitrospirillum amazonense]|uniref:protein-disulfide reductase DsbD family protein n=1 Tax=Nitrospirillum amazonense TaxID=28077 RepID=UPI002412CD9E|nr:thioredoxin family protein [Nitrospirillum amazonense]MDG3442170.1 protein-disulfide reductase DsbD family protein [Nitrospirillum amazonense]